MKKFIFKKILRGLIKDLYSYCLENYSGSSITTATIKNPLVVETRGETNAELFEAQHGLTIHGEHLLPMTYERELNPFHMYLNLVVFNSPKFGELLTTGADLKKLLLLDIGKVVNKIYHLPWEERRGLNTPLLEDVLKEKFVEFILHNTYKDVLGSVSPILSWREEGDFVELYVDGTIAINNMKVEKTLSTDEMINHLIGIIWREYKKKMKI